MTVTMPVVTVATVVSSESAPDIVSARTSPPTTLYITAPSAAVFSSAFAPSHQPCGPSVRLSPDSGLSRENFGTSSLVAGYRPPWAAAEATPINMIVRQRGATAVAAPNAPWRSRCSASFGSGRAITAGSILSRPCALSMPERSAIGTTKLAASMPAQAPRSGVRAMVPSRRACFLRCAVGFSVFSPLMWSLPPGDRDDRLDGGDDQLVDGPGEHADGEAAQAQHQEDLRREAHRERVERGRHPVEQAQRDVRAEQDRGQRAGDLQGRGEHVGEALRQHPVQRGERQRPAQRQ